MAFSPDGALIVSGSDDETLRLWDAKTGESIGTALKGHGGAVMSVAFSPDGTRIVSGSDDKTLRLWDTKTGKEVSRLELDSRIAGIAWRADRVAAGEVNGAVHVFRVIKPDDPAP